MKKLTCVLLAIIGFVSCLSALAQTGAYPYATLDDKGFDAINLGNSNIRFSIPIVSRAGRGLPFNYAIQYEGLVWQKVYGTYSNGYGGFLWAHDSSWGFNGAINGTVIAGTLSIQEIVGRPCANGSYPYETNLYEFIDPSGTKHLMNFSTAIDCDGNRTDSGDGKSYDNAGYTLINGGTKVQARNGVVILPARSYNGSSHTNQYTAVTDSQGNVISNNESGTFTDTLGVTALQISGGALPTTFTYPISHQADGVASAVATIAYGNFTVQTNFQLADVPDYGPQSNVSLPTQITLADNSAYHFTYEQTPGFGGSVTGRLASVQLPSGGTISYSYSGCTNNAGMGSDGLPCVMVRTTTDGAKSYYHYAPSNSGTYDQYATYTIDESNNETDYSFQLSTNGNAYEVHHTAFQGSGPYTSSGTHTSLAEHDVFYNQDWGRTQFIESISQIDVADSQNGQRLSHTATLLNAAGLPGEFDEFDYQDHLLRQTSSLYDTHNNLTDVQVKDGVHLQVVNHTSYGYDETAAIGTSNVPQHGTPSTSPGNLTSVHQWLDGSTQLQTTSVYYDTGAVSTTTTPSGTTTYTYDGTQAFVTGTTLPFASSGVQLGTGATYDINSAALTSATGYNAGQTMTMTVFDRLMRPTQVTMPDAGTSALGYSPGESTVQRLKSGSDYAWQSTQYDGYGRVKRTAVSNGFGGYYITDTCYGADGRAQKVTIPYATNTAYGAYDCSQNHETYTYDALGRVTNVTHADGTQRNFSYLIYNGAFSTLSTDELGKTRIVDTDALGRQTIVCEVTSTPLPQSGTLGQCNTAIGATGYKTVFTYDMANRASFVGQELQGRNSVVDAIGRTIYTYEPERGETTYSYEYQSNGELLVTRTRAAANHTECTVRAVDNFCEPNFKTKTITRYDTLGRMTIVEYRDATTNATVQPRRLYYHDVTGPGAPFPADNAKGLLTQAAIDSGDTNNSISRYTYDLMGRPTRTFDCVTGWCGPGGPNDIHRAFYRWYDYDRLGNKVHEAWNYGAYDIDTGTVTLTSAWSVAGELLGLQGGLGNVQYSAGARGAQGNLDEQYGNGVQATFAYDAMNRQVGRWACLYTTHPGCAAGQHLEGSYAVFTGNKVTRLINEQGDNTLGYDDLGRLSSRAPAGGGGPTLSWTYDRFGNRLSQTAAGSGSGSFPQPVTDVSPYSNKVNGYTYDLAGNLLNDGVHTYTYDQEGNLIYVDNGYTTWDNYDALNRRIMHVTGNYTNYLRYEYNLDGRLAEVWQGEDTYEKLSRYYGPKGDSFAYWTLAGGQVHYQHTDYLGTVKIRTDGNHNTEAAYSDLPFGERTGTTGTDDNTEHYALLDTDTESDTRHAQFRTYEPRIGRWLQPDPYDGSYSMGDPQSWNRYSYVMNNPLGFIDPSGLLSCRNETAWVNGGYDSTFLWCDLDEERGGKGNAGGPSQGAPRSGSAAGAAAGATSSASTPNKLCKAERIKNGIKGILNVGIASSKSKALGATVAETSSTVAGAPAAAVMAVYGTVTIASQYLTGAGQLWSAVTGNTLNPKFTLVLNLLSGPALGLSAKVYGSSDARAEQLAGYESLGTSGAAVLEQGDGAKLVDGLTAIVDSHLNLANMFDSSACKAHE